MTPSVGSSEHFSKQTHPTWWVGICDVSSQEGYPKINRNKMRQNVANIHYIVMVGHHIQCSLPTVMSETTLRKEPLTFIQAWHMRPGLGVAYWKTKSNRNAAMSWRSVVPVQCRCTGKKSLGISIISKNIDTVIVTQKNNKMHII